MHIRLRIALAIVSLGYVAAPLAAQQPSGSVSTQAVASPTLAAADVEAPATPAAGPTVSAAIAGVRQAAAHPAPKLEPPKRADTNQNRAMMIVGGAALIVGAIIGDTPGTLVMVGGAVVGLYGLYKFLQ